MISRGRIRPNVSFRSISSTPDDRSPWLFTSNLETHTGINGSKLQEHYKEYYENALTFKNPNYYYQKLNIQTVEDVEDVEIYETPAEDFGVILDRNLNTIPVCGSVVEFIHPTTFRVDFGVVIRESQARFDENLNKLVVLMSDNETIEISPMDVNFHCHSLIYGDFETIFDNITVTELSERKRILHTMHKFIQDSLKMKQLFTDKLDRLFFQFSTNRIRALSFAHLIDATQFPDHMVDIIKKSRWNQCALFMGLHLNLVNSCRWLVPKYILANKGSNIFNEGHSNNYISRPIYLVNTEANWIAISEFLENMKSETGLNKINDYFNKFYKQQTSQLAIQGAELQTTLTVTSDRHFLHVFDTLKFMIIYPHDSLLKEIRKLDVFKDVKTVRDIYTILENLKIFSQDQVTDVLVSSGILGDVSELTDEHKQSKYSYSSDNFTHLRGKGINKQIIYTLNSSSNSKIGVSLEKMQRNKHILRIHIPDPVTHHSPTSRAMRNAFHPEYGFVSGMDNLINKQHWFPLFPNQGFPIQKQGKKSSDYVTCMTISFSFNPSSDDPFSDLPSLTSVSFDKLLNSNIKNVDENQLEKCLGGVRLGTDVMRWLGESPKVNKADLTLQDQDTIRTIYHIIQQFFKQRNIHGASPSDPLQTPSSIDSSNLSYGPIITTKGIDGFEYILDNEEQLEAIRKERTIIEHKVVNNWPNTHESHFLINELRIFLGALISEYCIDKKIPVLRRAQYLDTCYFPEDKVMVDHRTVLQSAYDATSYSSMLYSKNSKGYMTSQNVLISKSFLSPELIVFREVEDKENIVLGLENGWANIVDTYSKGEAVINQLQILMKLQYQFQKDAIRKGASLITVQEYFSNIRSQGYETNGPYPEQVLAGQIENIINGDNDSKYVMRTIKRYWTLRCLQQDIRKIPQFQCMITKVGLNLGGVMLNKAYCLELDIEVDVLMKKSHKQYVGMSVSCNQVMYINPVGGVCLLKDVQLIVNECT